MKGIVCLVFGICFVFSCQHNITEFDYLTEPQISYKPAQKMLVIEVNGDPNTVGKDAFGQLFSSFFAIKKDYPDLMMNPPRVRWPLSAEVPADEWIGIYALPLSNVVEKLPLSHKVSPNARIDTWYDDEVAEILHVGAYEDETPTIEKLKMFINDQGYEIIGDHEEEYLKGPGMFFKGNPQKYRTIIRYEVSKKEIE